MTKRKEKNIFNIIFHLRHIRKEINHLFRNNKTIRMTYSAINKLSKCIRVLKDKLPKCTYECSVQKLNVKIVTRHKPNE